jgi:hypothetical protein
MSFILTWSFGLYFAFIICGLCVCAWYYKVIAKTNVKEFLPVFNYRSLISFRSHSSIFNLLRFFFFFCFCFGCHRVYFFVCVYPFSQYHSRHRLFSLLYVLGTLVKRSLIIWVGLLLGDGLLFWRLCRFLTRCHTALITTALETSLRSGNLMPLAFFFLLFLCENPIGILTDLILTL